MYCEVLVGSTEKTTLVLRVVQDLSWAGTYVKFTLLVAASHWAAPAATAVLTRS